MANDDETLELPAAPRAAGIAREFVRRCWSGESAETLDNVTLCVSEMVTNALDHARPPYELRIGRCRGRLRVEVTDASTATPQVKPISASSARGRGMFIVSNVATKWGVEEDAKGKTVWAEFPA
jgi:anti-sigma regulatory factor (Ser/Thr protein kinase)